MVLVRVHLRRVMGDASADLITEDAQTRQGLLLALVLRETDSAVPQIPKETEVDGPEGMYKALEDTPRNTEGERQREDVADGVRISVGVRIRSATTGRANVAEVVHPFEVDSEAFGSKDINDGIHDGALNTSP